MAHVDSIQTFYNTVTFVKDTLKMSHNGVSRTVSNEARGGTAGCPPYIPHWCHSHTVYQRCECCKCRNKVNKLEAPREQEITAEMLFYSVGIVVLPRDGTGSPGHGSAIWVRVRSGHGSKP